MALVDGTNYLPCGEPALKQASVYSLLKISCSKVYLKHLEKDEHIYEATSASLSVLVSQQSNSETLATRKRLASQESALHGATKRQCIIHNSVPESIPPKSPPIVVGIGYKSGYRSYPMDRYFRVLRYKISAGRSVMIINHTKVNKALTKMGGKSRNTVRPNYDLRL
uniref:Uncharacterized protein n=1 Tax=Amphimedon queenslandica TaxID=400682 RepID=A0A1X7VU45_AMPQE